MISDWDSKQPQLTGAAAFWGIISSNHHSETKRECLPKNAANPHFQIPEKLQMMFGSLNHIKRTVANMKAYCKKKKTDGDQSLKL